MLKQLTGIYLLCMFCSAAVAQPNNTSVHILYVPGIAEIYGRNYSGDLSMAVQLSTLENYILYKPVSENFASLPQKEAIVFKSDFNFIAEKPALYYLLINNKYGEFGYEFPMRQLWLGKGSHQLDIYAVTENPEDLKETNTFFLHDHYRLYYEGEYEKENKFLAQYTGASISSEKIFQRYTQERYKNYYDTTDVDTRKRNTETAGDFIAARDSIFNAIDSLAENLNLLYKKDLLNLNTAFDKIMQPELASLKNALKITYCSYYLTAFGYLQTPDKDKIAALATKLLKETELLKLPLSCQGYRNTAFSYVNAIMNAALTDTIAFASYNNNYHTMISGAIDRVYKRQPEMAEYLHAAAVDFFTKYLSYDSATIARKGFEDFKKMYPGSLYNPGLAAELNKKEEKFKLKQQKDSMESNTDAALADTVTAAEQVTIDPAMAAFTPPRQLNGKTGKAVNFWNEDLFTAAGKPVQLKKLKGKKIAIKALPEVPVSRDLAYFQYLEKKFPVIAFVYIFSSSADPAVLKLFQSFNLKGQCLFTKKTNDNSPADNKWNENIYYPYWQFINSKGMLLHVFQLDNIENLMSDLMQNKPFSD
jgi:hypothetical protein